MKAPSKLTLGIALALAGGNAWALGLGQIHVTSGLNQPLKAEIPILSESASELSELKVALASSEDFARVGLSRSRLTVPLSFSVVDKPGGRAVIEVTSEQPVGEPVLDFLVQVNWPKGKLLREYSVLLDPPVVAPAAAPAAAPAPPPPAHTPAQTTPAATPSPAPTRAASPPAAQPPSAAKQSAPAAAPRNAPAAANQNDRYGPVASGETLWAIANRLRANSGVSVNQMMVALLKANPDAFYKQNINALKSGAVLRIPDRAQIQTDAPVTAADSTVTEQNAAWSPAPTVVAKTGGRESGAPAASGESGNNEHLELVPPKEGGTSANARPGVAGGSGDTAVSGLRQDLARAKESLASAQQERDSLQSRVKDLEDLDQKNQRLLSMKNSQVAELQRKLAQARGEAPPATAASAAQASSSSVAANMATGMAQAGSSAASAASTNPAVSASAPAMVAGAASSATEPAAQASIAPVTATPKPVTPSANNTPPKARPTPVQVTSPGPAQTPWYQHLWVWLVAGLVVLGLLLLALFRRRGDADDADDYRALDDEDAQQGIAYDHDTVDVDGADAEEEQALIEQLGEQPDDLALHLELASLYYAHRDVRRFEAAAEDMFRHVDDPQVDEWQQVKAMGEEIAPEHPLFAAGSAAAIAAAEADREHDFDEDDFEERDFPADRQQDLADEPHLVPGPERTDAAEFDSDDEPVEPTTEAGKASDKDYSFDFDLTPEKSPATSEDAGTEPPAAGDSEPSYDLPEVEQPEPDVSESDMEDEIRAQDLDDEDLGAESDAPSSSADGATSSEESDRDSTDAAIGEGLDVEGFSDDPVDTKLDLARAYIDMGDAEGARAMLEEVQSEGSQVQQDTARKLLEEMDEGGEA